MNELMTAATELAALIPEIWSAKVVPTLKEKLPFNDCVSFDYEGEIQSVGDTVHIPKYPQFDDAQDLAEDSVSDADSVTPSNSDLVINHQLVKDYIVTYKAEVQSLESAQRLGDLAMHSILKKMQSILITDTVASASSPDHQISFDSGTTLALADILEAKELLDTAKVEEVNRKMIPGAAQLNDLLALSTFTSRDFVGGAPIQSGEVGPNVLGFELKWSTEVGNACYFFHPNYMQAAVQRAPKVGVYDLGVQGSRAMRFNFTVLFGCVQVDNKRVVEMA